MNKKQSKEIVKFWDEYKTSQTKELRNKVEKRYYAFFLNSLAPNSGIVKDIKLDRVELFEKNIGRIIFSIGKYKPWLVVKNKANQWKFTFDEKSVLEKLTTGWISEKIGKIRFHTQKPLTDGNKRNAAKLIDKFNELEKIFGYSIPVIDYYSSPDDAKISSNVIGETDKGAGNARYRIIKAVDRLDHTHELVHVFALEIGYVGPFIDEGIATTFGSKDLVSTKESCKKVATMLENGILFYLNGSNFLQAHIQGENVYGLSQTVMKYWHKKFGIKKIKMLLKKGIDDPLNIPKIIEEVFEKTDITKKNIKEILDNKCKKSRDIYEKS